MKNTSKSGSGLARVLRSAAMGAAMFVACAGGFPSVAMAQTKAPEIKRTESGTDQDVLVLRDGTILTGTIVSEDKTKVVFKRMIAGIPYQEEIELKKIAEIKKASKKPSDTPAPAGDKPSEEKPADEKSGADGAPAPEKADNSKKVEDVVGIGDGNAYYWIKLDGVLGRDISQTPVRDMVRDAREHKADVIIIEVNSRWTGRIAPEYIAYADPGRTATQVFRIEPITTIFTNDIPKEWTYKPRLVMWVKEGRGGIAPLPFVAPEMYFHPLGQLGALGGLESLFDGVGDEVVREKQRSLRLGHLEGLLRAGGYDYRIMRAMTRREYILTLGFDANGNAVMLDRRPETAGEELLTDSGEKSEADDMSAVAGGVGNDWLTLNARTAGLLGVSKGTADSQDELLLALGLDRSGKKIVSKSSKIMDDWKTSLDRAERALKKASREFADVRVEQPGGWNERRQARAKQKKYLQEMKRIQTQWGEGLLPEFLGQNRIPGIPEIDDAINTIDTRQQLDKKDK